MKMTGMKIAAIATVVAIAAKVISLEPSSAACRRFLPISLWRTMFSSILIASSTTMPIASDPVQRDRIIVGPASAGVQPDLAEVLGRAGLAEDPDVHLVPGRLDPAGGLLDLLGLDRAPDVRRRHLVLVQLLHVQPDAEVR